MVSEVLVCCFMGERNGVSFNVYATHSWGREVVVLAVWHVWEVLGHILEGEINI